MKLVLVIVFTVSAYGFYCPPYECGKLDTDICAIYKDYKIYVSESGCPDGKTCDLDAVWLMISVKKDKDLPAKLVKCLDENKRMLAEVKDTITEPGIITSKPTEDKVGSTEKESETKDKDKNRYKKDSIDQIGTEVDEEVNPVIVIEIDPAIDKCKIEKNIELESGSHPKVCESDNDCTLENGKKAKCLCGMNSYAYCQPNPFSDVFSKYVSDCKNLTNDEKREWTYIQKYYPLLASENPCLEKTFAELKLVIPKYDSMVYESHTSDEVSEYAFYLLLSMLYLLLIL